MIFYNPRARRYLDYRQILCYPQTNLKQFVLKLFHRLVKFSFVWQVINDIYLHVPIKCMAETGIVAM